MVLVYFVRILVSSGYHKKDCDYSFQRADASSANTLLFDICSILGDNKAHYIRTN